MLRILQPRFAASLALAALASSAGLLSACGPSSIRVDGVMRQSSDMRPLPNVPVGAYQKLRIFVRAAPAQESRYGSSDCGYTRLEGTDEGQDVKNAACVPPDTLNAVIGIVRQRLRSYGIVVVRDATDPYDYRVDVAVTGEAPRRADRTLVRALATVAFRLNTEVVGGTLMSRVAVDHARAAFAAVAADCSMRDADLAAFSGASRQPMTPDFDVQALASDAVDDVLRCDDLARFFLDLDTRFPR